VHTHSKRDLSSFFAHHHSVGSSTALRLTRIQSGRP
jgi:hypothetical protein